MATSVVTLKIVVAGLASVREQFDRLKVYRATAGVGGPYVELTTPTTRIPLEEGRVVYEYQDTAGNPDYFYRISYYNVATMLESSKSDPQQGEGDSALDILSVSELKTNYLSGVDLSVDDGTPFPDSLFEFYIKSAVSYVEHKFDMPLRPTRYAAETHDYYKRDYISNMFVPLDKYPIIEVEEIRMVFPGTSFANGRVFSGDDLYIEKESGLVNIIPGGNGSIFTGAALYRADFVPQVFRATYTAGFESGKCPAIIRDFVGRYAAFGPLNIAGDLLGGAGVASQSISIDGLSQSIATTSSPSFSGYGARLLNYAKDLVFSNEVDRDAGAGEGIDYPFVARNFEFGVFHRWIFRNS